jgi:hypothetical protein
MMMKRFLNRLSIVAFVGIFGLGLVADVAAQRPNAREVRDLVRSLNAKVEDLGYNLSYQMRTSSQPRQTVEDARSGIDNLTDAIKTFEDNLSQRRENRNDIQDIVSAGQNLNSMVLGTGQNRQIENGWNDVRNLIDRLAGNYGVTPNWNDRGSNSNSTSRNKFPTSSDDDYPSVSNTSNFGLTGTYDIDTSRSESVADAISGVQVSSTQRQDLEAKLTAPHQLAISVRGNQVMLGSSKGTPITFTADGTEKTEQVDGRSVRVKATLRGEELTVSSLGGETDYTVTFVSEDGGKTLKVTRRITTDYLNETVFADSVYTKSDAIARLGIESMDLPDDGNYSSNDPTDRAGSRTGTTNQNPTLSQPRIGQFIVPNGTMISGVLDNEINTKVSQNNDRFKMTVQEPMEYRGAIVEGFISGVGRSGQVSGRSNVTFNFERITLRDGKVYDFSGNVQAIKDTNGKEVRVDNEGTAKGNSQTTETAKRGGIGAGLGALIGAIAGGGKGAVIGAIIGGGAGAGSVAIMGRDDVRLMPGSTISILSSSPIREASRQDN